MVIFKKFDWLLIITYLVATRFYDCTLFEVPQIASNVMAAILIILTIYEQSRGRSKTNRHYNKFNNMDKIMICFIIFPTISMYSAIFFHNQNLVQSILAITGQIYYLYYFILKFSQKNVVKVINSLLLLGVVFSFIQILQQITFPTFYFGFINEGNEGYEVRNNLYRIRVPGEETAVFLFFYSVYRTVRKFSIKYITFIMLALVGIYLTSTRQVIAASLGSMLFVMVLSMKGKKSIIIFAFLLVFGFIIYSYSNQLFGDMIEDTEKVDENYIRFASFKYFGIDANMDNTIAKLIGNGEWYGSSSYGTFQQRLATFGLYASDIGIVGVYYKFGIIYVLLILCYFILFFKSFKRNYSFINMIGLYILLTSAMLLNFIGNVSALFISAISYIMISKKEERTILTNKHAKMRIY